MLAFWGLRAKKKSLKMGIYIILLARMKLGCVDLYSGDQLILKATVITNRRGIYKFSAEASVDNQLVGEMLILCAERKIDVD